MDEHLKEHLMKTIVKQHQIIQQNKILIDKLLNTQHIYNVRNKQIRTHKKSQGSS